MRDVNRVLKRALCMLNKVKNIGYLLHDFAYHLTCYYAALYIVFVYIFHIFRKHKILVHILSIKEQNYPT